MSHNSTIFSQILKFVPRHEFSKLSKKHDGNRRQGAMSRWTQFVAMASAQLTGRTSLRDIESTLAQQKHLRYHLGCGNVKRSTLARVNQTLSADYFRNFLASCINVVNKLNHDTNFVLKENYFHSTHRYWMYPSKYFHKRNITI